MAINMAKKPRSKQTRRNGSLLDAVAEIVHQGYGRVFDASELRAHLDGWQPNCSMNYEYVFAWKPFAKKRLKSGTDCKWVDLSFITDSKGRPVYVLEIGDAVAVEDEDVDSIIERHEQIWHWKSQPLTIVGLFASLDEAEAWMAENGAFKEAD